ncbi:MAG TPA: hypothetical protein VHM90_02725 [Phycisphaerae bacterium]|nr:hypothetical protein [Phycisphaerae bacterium]
MVRRFLRIFTPLGLLVLFAAAVVSQYWMSLVRVPICLLYCGRDGIGIERRADWRWSAEFFHRPDRAFSNFFALPSTYIASGNPGIFLPWWLLLTCWLMLTVITWRITRRKAPHRFSVGPGPVQTKTIS